MQDMEIQEAGKVFVITSLPLHHVIARYEAIANYTGALVKKSRVRHAFPYAVPLANQGNKYFL
jgi:hypothetical protein